MAADALISVTPVVLPKSNPYAKGRILIFANGDQRMVRDLVDYVPKESDDYYTVQNEDTLTRIAYDFYKAKRMFPSKYWWVIADANNIRNPLDMSSYIGKEIVIPDIINFELANQ